MRIENIAKMKSGWFIGDFEPSLFKTADFEVGIKKYEVGEYHVPHYHKISTELNYLICGTMKANGTLIRPGEIFIFEPGEVATCEFLTNCEIVVVKVPSAKDDKYEVQ